MHYLILSILSSSCIILVFNRLDKYGIRTFHAIAVNYVFATLLGWILIGWKNIPVHFSGNEFLPLAATIGVLFVVMFYVIGLTARKSGVTVTAVASRLSVIIPICFSIIFYRETLGWIKIAGIVLALPALVLTSVKNRLPHMEKLVIFLPFILFLGTGLTDTLVKFTQQQYLTGNQPYVFSTLVFFTSLITASLTIAVRFSSNRALFRTRTFVAGGLLGIFNFSSLFFFVQTLNHAPFDSSVIFGMNHLGIILLTFFSGILLFREKITRLNLSGLILACISITLLYYA